MNKLFYRIVFNKARGMVMVVADITRSHRAGVSPSSGSDSKPASGLIATLMPLTFGISLALAQITPAMAGIVADKSAPGNQQPQIISSANGTTQVNIQTPSKAGVSRNTYSQFDVEKRGAILNNSHKDIQTQLGGMVAGNQNLAKGEAKIILNEVNSRDPSKLNGYLEVAGQKAQVVIANPSGITCDGCGYINANRATLTTGQVQMNNGQITGYDVNKGEIVVQGAGMDSSTTDSTDLIARAVKVNAGVWAKNLKVTAGRNIVDAAHETVTAKKSDASATPTVAIDVASLGGMYANKIRLIGTEQGVGVHNAGNIGASAGDVVLNADGSLSNSGAINASQNLDITTQGNLDNQGTLYASADTTVNSRGNLQNSGTLAAHNNTHISAQTISSTTAGTLAGGMNDDGSLAGAGDLILNSQGQLSANGQNIAAGTLTAQGTSVDLSSSRTLTRKMALKATTGNISTRNATVAANQKLTASTTHTLDNTGGTLSADQLDLTARSLINQKGTVQQLGNQDLRLSFADSLDNSGGTLLSNSNNLSLNTSVLNNQSGSLLHGGTGAMNLTTGQFSGDHGTLISKGDLTLTTSGLILDNATTQANRITLKADSLSHRQGDMAQTGSGATSVTVKNALDNTGGSIATNGDLALQAGSLSNQSGQITAAGDDATSVTVQNALDNTGGDIAANSNLTLHAKSLNNQGGQITATGTGITAVTVNDALDNTRGNIATNGDLALQTASLTNQSGRITAAGTGITSVTVNNALNNASGNIATSGDLTLQAGSLANQNGQVTAAGNGTTSVSVNNTLDNTGGSVVTGGNLTLQAGSLTNQGGKIVAAQKGNLSLTTRDAMNNQQGTLASGGSLLLNSAGLNNDNGLVQSGSDMTLVLGRGSLSNRNGGQNGGILSQEILSISAGNLDNSQGFIGVAGDATLDILALNNQQGILSGSSNLNLLTGAVDNHNGLLQATQRFSLNTQGNTLSNDSGQLSSGEAMTLQTGSLTNQSGDIRTSGALTLNTNGQLLDNTQGSIAAAGDARLDTAGLNNIAGQVQIVGEAVINALSHLIDNTEGLLRSGESLALNAAKLVNHNTQADNTGIEGPSVSINAQTLDNSSGNIRSTDALDVAGVSSLDNSSGLLSSAADMSVNGNGLAFTNTDGTLVAGHSLALTANSLTGDGDVLSQGDMALALQQAFLNQGNVIANGNMQFNLANRHLINQGAIKAGNILTLNAASLDNQLDAEITAGENHLLLSGDVTNRGLIDGGLTHIKASTLTNTGTGRLYGDHIALQAVTLNNEAENGVAATIAARDSMDIGTGTLNNSTHALIYSDGDLAIGGSLDNNWLAVGQANVFNNHSATLESMGDMMLNIGQINNYNDHLVTQDVIVSQTAYHTGVLKGSVDYFNWDDIDTSTHDKYDVHYAIMPDGTKGKTFYEYQYTETVKETQVLESDPGKILAGGNLTINSNQLNNYDSQIVAGGVLGGNPGQLNNIATQGTRVITDTGTVRRWYSKKTSHPLKGDTTSQGKDTSDYTPAPTTQTIDLQTMKWQENTRPDGSGATINGRDKNGDNTTIVDAGDVTADTGQAVVIPPSGQTPVTPPPGQTVEVVQPGDDSTVIRIITPDLTLPDNSLYQTHPEATAGYLVETDPRFTNGKQWLSSDYMQNQLGIDQTMKRLGDGYYEQRLVREQVIALSGQRYFSGYSNDEQQYKALMDAGVAFAKQYGLAPGVALTSAQMALLTTDMVWMVAQNVTMPDGTTQRVLVPQVYARVKQGDLDGSGALLGGNDIALNISHDLTNSGHINGRSVTQITAENINNSGFIGGNNVSLAARTDINNIGGTLQGGDSLTAIAGRDINSVTTLGGSAGNITLDRPAGIYVQNDNGELGLQALRNINLTGSLVSNAGANSQTQIIAGNDLNLNTITTTHSESSSWSKGNDRSLNQSTDIGSQINGNGDVALSAGHDVNARAATVTAQNGLTVAAGNDINVTSGQSTYDLTENSFQSGGSLFSHSSVRTHDEVHEQDATGSNLSGDTITMQAGHDMTVSGSSIAGTHDVNLAAGNNLTITTADESRKENHLREEKSGGLSGTGGIGVRFGSDSTKITDDNVSQSSAASTVGSSQGNVSLNAGNNLTIQGSKVLAGQDMALTGKEVNILAAQNQSTQTHTVEQKTSGLTLALSGMVGSAINTAVSQATDASKQSDGRMAALDGMQSALSGVQAYQASQAQNDASNPQGSMIGVNLSYGSQSSKSTQTQKQNNSQGSSLMAGNNLSINATGTDINVQGSQLQAGGNAVLNAARDVNLFSAENTHSLTGKNESHGGSVGVGINFGQGANGITVSASANVSKGHETGNGTTHTESTINAGNQVSINSGRDTTLTGAQVSGDQVVLDVGRNLTMTSEQDSDNYDSKQQSASAGGSVSMGGGSGSINLSQSKIHSTWDSVEEQTGIFAGKGGFDVTVGDHTQLNGAVIGSTAAADKNKLDTGTLGFSDIKNHADYSVEQQSVGISSGGSAGGQFLGNMANGLLAGMGDSGSASSTTRAAVSDGSITIRDQANQKQDVANLDRDAAHANQTLSPIFDKEKEQNRLAQAQKIAEIGVQAGDVIRTQGKLNAQKAQSDPAAREKAREQLIKNGNASPTDADISKQVTNNVMADYGTGGTYQKVSQAVTAAMQGLAGGNMAEAIAGASSPYVAGIIHSMTTDDKTGEVNSAENAMAHAVWGAVSAATGGNSALAGAAGAVSGEAFARYIAGEMYPGTKLSDLSEDQKQTLSALGTLAAGLAGGVVGGNTANAVAGATTGKNAVENNSLASVLAAANANKPGTAEKWKDEQQAAIKEACSGNTPMSCQQAVALMGTVASMPITPLDLVAAGLSGAGAVAIADKGINGSVDLNNVMAAYWGTMITKDMGFVPTVFVNATAGATVNYVEGNNPGVGWLAGTLGGSLGYAVGNKIATPLLDKIFNTATASSLWTDIGMGISRGVEPSSIPAITGGAIGGGAGEAVSDVTNNAAQKTGVK